MSLSLISKILQRKDKEIHISGFSLRRFTAIEFYRKKNLYSLSSSRVCLSSENLLKSDGWLGEKEEKKYIYILEAKLTPVNQGKRSAGQSKNLRYI